MLAFLGNVRITEDDMDMLERLAEVNGTNGSLFIFDGEMRNSLRMQGYIQMNTIGWVWGTDRLRQAVPRLRRTFDRQVPDVATGYVG